jgi:mRNA degradation ribonuclease J1/J2
MSGLSILSSSRWRIRSLSRTALIIRTAGGTVLHTGDWKIDPTPILHDPTDEKKLRALGEEGLSCIGR